MRTAISPDPSAALRLVAKTVSDSGLILAHLILYVLSGQPQTAESFALSMKFNHVPGECNLVPLGSLFDFSLNLKM